MIPGTVRLVRTAMRLLRKLTLLAFAAVVAALAQPVVAANEVTSMDAFLWQNRPVLVFVPAADHPLLAAQRAALSGEAPGLNDREIIVIEVVGSDVTVDGWAAPGLAAARLRQRYRVGEGEAAALLVGKDGGVKMRQVGALSTDALYPTIDAMPMRRQEMRERGGT